SLTTGLDDPPPGYLVLRDGQVSETLQYDTGQHTLDTYLGYGFTVANTDALVNGLRASATGVASLLVRNLADDSVQELAVGPGVRVGLPDGTMLGLESIRELSVPAAAMLRVTRADGAATEI